MKHVAIIAAVLLIAISPVLAAPVVEWQSRFGGPDQDWANSVVPISGGGYLAAGTYLIQPGNPIYGGSEEFLLARTDAEGNPLWQRRYDLGLMSWGANAVEAGDGGFVMAGTVHVQWNYFNSHTTLIKTDGDGNILWTKTFSANRPHSIDNTEAGYVQRTADGGFILLVTYIEYVGADNTIMLIKTDADGNEVWRARPGVPMSYGNMVRQTSDGGYAVCGSIGDGVDESAYDSYNTYLLKTDQNGDTEWTATYEKAGYDACGALRQTADGGFVLFGNTMSFGVTDTTDYILTKTDSTGNLTWQTVWGAAGDDWSGGVAEIDGGGFVVSGSRRSVNITDELQVQIEVAQFSAGGRKLSGILLGEPSWSGRPYAEGISIEKTDDGGFVVGGLMVDENWDPFLAKLAPMETGELVNVTIDIKPGSAINPINLRSQGTTPVAIFGTADFDAAQVDPATVTLAGAPVATNSQGKLRASVTDVDEDGLDDLVLHVVTARMTLAVGDTSATLTGQTYDGTPIEGSDKVTVIKRRNTRGTLKRQARR